MGRHILIIQGHPDSGTAHFCHALADAYAVGAKSGGHEVRRLGVSELALPLLRSKAEWDRPTVSGVVRECQELIRWADHLVIVYPLWLGGMPAVLKGFFEQVARPGFAIGKGEGSRPWMRLLKGKSARIVVTMGMPALVYRWYFGAHSLKSLERNILGFVGVAPIRETLIGMIDELSGAKRKAWLDRLQRLGVECA